MTTTLGAASRTNVAAIGPSSSTRVRGSIGAPVVERASKLRAVMRWPAPQSPVIGAQRPRYRSICTDINRDQPHGNLCARNHFRRWRPRHTVVHTLNTGRLWLDAAVWIFGKSV